MNDSSYIGRESSIDDPPKFARSNKQNGKNKSNFWLWFGIIALIFTLVLGDYFNGSLISVHPQSQIL